MNEVVNINDLRAGLTKYKQEAPAVMGGELLLRLGRDGVWVYGAENTELQEGSRWAVNPFSIEHGWSCWTDHPGKTSNELVGEVMVPFNQSPPPETELPDKGWKWSRQVSVMLACTNGDDEGTNVLYKTTSVGGKRMHQAIVTAVSKQIESDPVNVVPVVELSADNYEHKKWGKTYTPDFKIVGWTAINSKEVEPAEKTAAAEPTPAQEGREALREAHEATMDKQQGDGKTVVRRRRRRAS